MLFLTQNLAPSQVVCLGYKTFASGMLPDNSRVAFNLLKTERVDETFFDLAHF